MSKFAAAVCVMALGFVFPVLAKDKNGQSVPGAPSEQGDAVGTNSLTDPILADAIRLCQLVVDDDDTTLETFENEGWTHEVDREIGNARYYKEITAQLTYGDVGEAEIWGFIEDYPSSFIGYCSFSITNPSVRFSISAINDMDRMVGETHRSEEQVFGAWNDVSSQPSVFIHAYHNSDTFTYQITRINKAD